MAYRLLGLVATALAAALAMSPANASAEYTPRTGFVTLQFDDSHEYHYTHILPMLQAHGFQGSFGYVTESSELGIEHDAWKMVEIYQAGHEVQDHTTRHNYMWATHVDTVDDGVDEWIEYTVADMATWDSLCERSLEILDSLGIQAVGWNQPGGSSPSATVPGHPGWRWMGWVNDSLYTLIASKYLYAIGQSVWPHTAHLNHRGHNCPDRFPFYNVPYNTIDGDPLEDVKRAIADAVASGLWYLAVSHAGNPNQVALVDSVVQWLDEKDIEVLTCRDGWERIFYGDPDPSDNQLPHARMLKDLDGNGKPDGFWGYCLTDTATAPVDSANCIYVYGETTFYCYGPELGANALSMWLKSTTETSSTVRVVWISLDYGWNTIESGWNTLEVTPEWTRFDTLSLPDFMVEVSEEADRVKFFIRLISGPAVLAAYPDLRSAAAAGVGDGARRIDPGPALTIAPNPAAGGRSVRIETSNSVFVWDVHGRLVLMIEPSRNGTWPTMDTDQLGPGVFFVTSPSNAFDRTKLVIIK
jgi:peptidoglycan/xylan/chitin deacetylase (PgdA/CDA1 family)